MHAGCRVRLSERRQDQEIGVIAEQLQAVVGSEHQERVADFEARFGDIVADRTTFAQIPASSMP